MPLGADLCHKVTFAESDAFLNACKSQRIEHEPLDLPCSHTGFHWGTFHYKKGVTTLLSSFLASFFKKIIEQNLASNYSHMDCAININTVQLIEDIPAITFGASSFSDFKLHL